MRPECEAAMYTLLIISGSYINCLRLLDTAIYPLFLVLTHSMSAKPNINLSYVMACRLTS